MEFVIRKDDVFEFDADLLLLKYSRLNYGVDAKATEILCGARIHHPREFQPALGKLSSPLRLGPSARER